MIKQAVGGSDHRATENPDALSRQLIIKQFRDSVASGREHGTTCYLCKPTGTDCGDSHCPHARVTQLAAECKLVEYSGGHCNAKAAAQRADFQPFHGSISYRKIGMALRHSAVFCGGKGVRWAVARLCDRRNAEAFVVIRFSMASITVVWPGGACLCRHSWSALLMVVRVCSFPPFRIALGHPAPGGARMADAGGSAA